MKAFHKVPTLRFVAQNVNAVKSYSQCFNQFFQKTQNIFDFKSNV